MKILVIDVGGTNVKVKRSDGPEVRKIPSGPTLTPHQMAAEVQAAAADWPFDAVTVGYPGPVVGGKIVQE
ncbi:MAG: ROK family protein, partial [Gemmataceae bacterium]